LKHGHRVRLLSPKNRNLAADFPTVADTVRALDLETALLDGEIVAVDPQGRPSFQMLQNRASLGRKWRIVYYAFDLLNVNGEDLRRHPLEQRKEKLRTIVPNSGVLYNSDLPGNTESIIQEVAKLGLEGVVAKQRNSSYEAGKRSAAWLKVKLDKSQEFVVGGYNPTRRNFQSLLIGYYERGKLLFAGKLRQGINPSIRAQLWRTIRPLETKQCPFTNLPSSKSGHFGEGVTAEEMPKLRWLRPELVVQVRFTEWTTYRLLRHATFIGVRDDKDPKDVRKESAAPDRL
jgi:bifunctional non-homologous end joining protein LigD